MPEGVPCWNTAWVAHKNYQSSCSARPTLALLTSQATCGKLCASQHSNPGLPEGVPCCNTAGMARKNYPSSCSARQKLAPLTSQATSGKLCASLRSNPGLPEGVLCCNTAGVARKNYLSSCSARQKSDLSQGGVCQVAPSSCRSFEGCGFLLRDPAHVTCSP